MKVKTDQLRGHALDWVVHAAVREQAFDRGWFDKDEVDQMWARATETPPRCDFWLPIIIRDVRVSIKAPAHGSNELWKASASPAFFDACGRSPGEAVGRCFAQMVFGKDVEVPWAMMSSSKEMPAVFPFKAKFLYPKEFTSPIEYNVQRGRIVTVLRPLTEKEADGPDQGCEQMFRFVADNGWQGDAWASELEPVTVPA